MLLLTVTHTNPPHSLSVLQGTPSQNGPTSPSRALGPGRSSCGTSSWSCWGKRSIMMSSPGRATMASLSSRTQMKWPGCGGPGSVNPKWTMISWAGHWGKLSGGWFLCVSVCGHVWSFTVVCSCSWPLTCLLFGQQIHTDELPKSQVVQHYSNQNYNKTLFLQGSIFTLGVC